MANVDAVKERLDAQAVQIEKLNTKADNLVAGYKDIKKELEDLKKSGGATPAELDALIVTIDANTASVVAEQADVDSAGAEGAGTPAP